VAFNQPEWEGFFLSKNGCCGVESRDSRPMSLQRKRRRKRKWDLPLQSQQRYAILWEFFQFLVVMRKICRLGHNF